MSNIALADYFNAGTKRGNGIDTSDETVEGKLHDHPKESPKLHSTMKLIICSLGIFFCYFYYGIIQEKITKTKYGDKKEPFTYIQSLVFIQCVVNAIFGWGVVRWKKPGFDATPAPYYAACSFSYLAAMLSSNYALEYISYPTQVLGKSCKPIPIMLMGVVFAHKRYPLIKYLFVLMIVCGVSFFLYKEKDAQHAHGSVQFGFGECLLLLSLAMDGVTGAVQERMKGNYATKSHHMMLQMNLWSSLYNFLGLLLTAEIVPFLTFVGTYSSVLIDMVLFSVASALGQYFIFVMVADFGPLPCSIVTTTRKFFTVLFSVLYFGNSLNSRQWIGTFLVFIGLALYESPWSKSKAGVVRH